MTPSAEDDPRVAWPPDTPAAMRVDSLHTPNFPDLLRQLGGSLVVTTGDSGKLVILRPDGALVGPHSIALPRPAGIAFDGQRIAVAAAQRIIEFHDLPDVARHLHDPPRHDAVYLARRSHVTGAIGIGEMAWDAHGELWFASAQFSSLCTLDAHSAVVPRWRPRFVSRCVPEDRCHLNGLGLRDGRPRYATALGETDTPQGWRGKEGTGGILIDCETDAILARGLSRPHSPRWYDDRLWLLESGRGALVNIDPHTGHKTDVAHVPGFARGLDFLGPVAFVGLSCPRETATAADCRAGLRAVHLGTGRTLARLEFTGVSDVVAVQALPGVRFPEIVCAGELLAFSYALPPEALPDVDPALSAAAPVAATAEPS